MTVNETDDTNTETETTTSDTPATILHDALVYILQNEVPRLTGMIKPSQ